MVTLVDTLWELCIRHLPYKYNVLSLYARSCGSQLKDVVPHARHLRMSRLEMKVGILGLSQYWWEEMSKDI